MKKLVMVLAVALAIGVSQAAFVDWTINLGKEDGAGKTYYVFDGSNSEAVLAVLASFDDGSAAKIDGLKMSTGSLNAKAGKASGDALDVGNSKSLMMLVLDDTLAADKGYKYAMVDISNSIYTPPETTPGYNIAAKDAFSFTGTIKAAGTDPVTPGGVPEPTSGLLLVLGGAALALRRKQK